MEQQLKLDVDLERDHSSVFLLSIIDAKLIRSRASEAALWQRCDTESELLIDHVANV